MVVEIINRPGVAWADLQKKYWRPEGRIKLNEIETCIRRLCKVSRGFRGYQEVIREEKSIRRLYRRIRRLYGKIWKSIRRLEDLDE